MENQRSYSAVITPTEGNKFKFPPDMCLSVDRLRNTSDHVHTKHSFRRSFTPTHGALYVKSPDISPIELNIGQAYNFKRLPPEKVLKVRADTTVVSKNDINVTYDEDFVLMPPPPGRWACSGTMKRNLKKIKGNVREQDDILNAQISLTSLLMYTGLDRYIDIFDREEINLEILLIMTDNDLMRIGVDDAQDRASILQFKNLYETNNI